MNGEALLVDMKRLTEIRVICGFEFAFDISACGAGVFCLKSTDGKLHIWNWFFCAVPRDLLLSPIKFNAQVRISVMKLDYCVLGTNNIEEAIKFYDSLFDQTELSQVLSTDRMTFWQCEDFAFAVAKPFNGELATNGNGTMIGINVGSIKEVTRLHKKAIELGGTCEGEPGQRGPKYSAYVRDLDKNKIVFSV